MLSFFLSLSKKCSFFAGFILVLFDLDNHVFFLKKTNNGNYQAGCTLLKALYIFGTSQNKQSNAKMLLLEFIGHMINAWHLRPISVTITPMIFTIVCHLFKGRSYIESSLEMFCCTIASKLSLKTISY